MGTKSKAELEIAHVLFIDTVGYSKLSVVEQREWLDTLNRLVRSSERFRAAEVTGELIRLPTGDGMALVFSDSPESPAQCAAEISQALKDCSHLPVRMGIHSGPVSRVTDVNDRSNAAGAGINIAQRVMSCGDAGHILLSKRAAEDLIEYPRWRPYLHEIGECAFKHGTKITLVNFYDDQVGNAELPIRFQEYNRESRRRLGFYRRHKFAVLTAIAIGLLLGGYAVFNQGLIRSKWRSPDTALAIPEKSIAVLPFENLSEEKGNAYFAEGIQNEILTRLAMVRDLKVISRTSTAKYQSKPDNLKTVAQELGVSTVLEGAVQKAGDKVRVNVQLIDARADTHLWAKSYDRDLKDVLGVESEVSQEIAEALQANLSPSESHALASVETHDAEAYDLF